VLDKWFKEEFTPVAISGNREFDRKRFAEAFLKYFILKWMGEHSELAHYDSTKLLAQKTLDTEISDLYKRRLFHGYLQEWQNHKCKGHSLCSHFFTMDGHVKLSHAICASERNPSAPCFYDMPETGKVALGCVNQPEFGHKFCGDCLKTCKGVDSRTKPTTPSTDSSRARLDDGCCVIQRIHGDRTRTTGMTETSFMKHNCKVNIQRNTYR
jgi:hypothetical protein